MDAFLDIILKTQNGSTVTGLSFLQAMVRCSFIRVSIWQVSNCRWTTSNNFASFRSLTPGHPEFHITDGVEATTGPLGQGVANAVGQAFGLKLLGAKFNTDKYQLFNSKVYCLAGDGCIMEGISSEASSLAGHLALDNLVLIYDANKVTLDGFLEESCSEDTKMRYRSYGWDVYDIDGYDFDKMQQVFANPRESKKTLPRGDAYDHR